MQLTITITNTLTLWLPFVTDLSRILFLLRDSWFKLNITIEWSSIKTSLENKRSFQLAIFVLLNRLQRKITMTTYQKWCLVSNRKGLFLWIVWSIIRISLADQLSSSLNTTSDPLSNTFASSNSSTVNQFNTITNVKSSLTSSGNSLLPNALNASLATSNTSRVLMANTSLVDEVSFNICSVRCEQCTPSTSDCTAICGPLFECAHRNSSQNITYILKRFYCDAICDCDDCSDEIKCALDKCQPDETMCQDKSRCIKPSQVCDGRFDCKDYSDELGCGQLILIII